MSNTQKILFKILTVSTSLAFIFHSCKKIDNLTVGTEKGHTFVQKFFAANGTESKEILNIIEALKKENEKNGFVNKLPANCGLPVWNKLIQQKQTLNNSSTVANTITAHSASQITLNGNTTIFIPLTQNGKDLSAIIIFAGDSQHGYTINCYTQFYLYQICHDSAVNANYAKDFLILFLFMENNVFGTMKFYHLPSKFFPKITKLDAEGNKTLTINNNPPPPPNLTEICVTVCCPICNGADPNCPLGGCWQECTPIGTGGGGTGGGGAGGGGAGGGGTGGGGCSSAWYANIAIGGDCNPPPPPPPVYSDPCLYISQLEIDQNFIAKFHELNQNPALFADFEKGYQVNNRTANNYGAIQGQPESPSIKWNIPAGTKSDGFLHCHYLGLSNIFSPQDLIFMAQVFLLGYAADTANLFMGVTSNIDNPYLIKVNNIAKFRAFAISIVGASGNDEGKIDRFIKDYNELFNSTNPSTYIEDNKKAFLKMINDKLGGDGLTMFQGNPQCNQWTKLKLNNNGTISANTCNY